MELVAALQRPSTRCWGKGLGPRATWLTCGTGRRWGRSEVETKGVKQGEAILGRLTIPKRYTDYETSGIVIEATPDPEAPIEIDLTD